MRILDLNEYISEKLNIHPVTKDMLSKFREELYIDEKTRRFIEENDLVWNPKTMSYDCGSDVIVSEDIVIDGKLKIRFGKVDGYFDCIGNKLTTLEGAPQEVGGYFSCSNNNLTTLEGAPQEIGKDFDCSFNNLTTLEGAPKKVGGYFSCSYNNLTTLEGAPKEVGGYFRCSYNPNLVLPKEKPSWLKGKIIR
jgi:hypothetical protein